MLLLETDMFDGSMNLYCSFRMDEMMKGQRGWRELAELGEKGPKFSGMLESIIWSPKGGDADKLGEGWHSEEVKLLPPPFLSAQSLLLDMESNRLFFMAQLISFLRINLMDRTAWIVGISQPIFKEGFALNW